MLLDLLPLFGDTGSSTGGGFPYAYVCGTCLRHLLPGEDCPDCTERNRRAADEHDLVLLGVV